MGIFTKILDQATDRLIKYSTKSIGPDQLPEPILPKLPDSFKNIELVGESGAGLVRIMCNGFGDVTKVEIDDMIFKETDKNLISDLFVAALKDVNKKIMININKISYAQQD